MQLLGERACKRVLEQITTPGLRQRVEVLGTDLVLRSSCGCPPGTAARVPVPPLSRQAATSPSPTPWPGSQQRPEPAK
jgi:hypothetical protein